MNRILILINVLILMVSLLKENPGEYNYTHIHFTVSNLTLSSIVV